MKKVETVRHPSSIYPYCLCKKYSSISRRFLQHTFVTDRTILTF